MSTTYRIDADCPQQARMLRTMAIVATLLHAVVLYGVDPPPSPKPTSVREQGVTIELAPVLPHRGERHKVAAPVPSESPAPPMQQPKSEFQPDPVPTKPTFAPRKARPVQRQKPKATTATQIGKKNTPSQTVDAPQFPAPAEQKASRTVTTSPEPLPSYSNPKPVYPELARKRGQEGRVLLSADIDEKGELTELRVDKSSGFSLLDEAALKAVRRWRFKPALRAGMPVKGTALIPIEFLLRG